MMIIIHGAITACFMPLTVWGMICKLYQTSLTLHFAISQHVVSKSVGVLCPVNQYGYIRAISACRLLTELIKALLCSEYTHLPNSAAFSVCFLV